MLPHRDGFTKPFSMHFPLAASGLCRLLTVSLLFSLLMTALPASALLKMETKTINAALVYGMKHQKEGISSILGNNWVENGEGALLNIYSPFMMLATKASRAGLSSRPTSSDLQQARKRFGKEVAFYSDTRNRLTVKFAISFYGPTPDFAKTYYARIEGIGRGKSFEVKPSRQALDQIADPIGKRTGATYTPLPPVGSTPADNTTVETPTNPDPLAEPGSANGTKPAASSQPVIATAPAPPLYEAINAYYFHLADIVDLQEFQLILESPKGPPLTFRLNNDRLY